MAARHLLLYYFIAFFSSHWGNDAADIRSCVDNFVVHTNKIIRTQDSRALGAKYLTEAEVSSRDDCLQLCCETVTCDVFVYEHKRRGSCYLFHCGDPQDFKCKFTQHRNYSSGLLMPPNELEAQIKLTKHEQELAQLSKKTEVVSTVAAASTTPLPTTTIKVPVPAKVNATARSECSRYQFECRSTKECIAIYNACDGIPQCRDGSDEAPELDCPALAAGSAPSGAQVPMKMLPGTAALANPPPDVKKSYGSPQQQLAYHSFGATRKSDSDQESLDAHQQLVNARMYGREGEGPGDANGWPAYMGQARRPQEDGSHVFSYKAGIETGDSAQPAPSLNEMGRSEFPKSSGGGSFYGSFPYNNAPQYNWPQRQRDDPRWMYPGPPPDYYNFEESQARGRLPVPDHRAPASETSASESQQPKDAEPSHSVAKQAEKTTLTKVEEDKPKTKETASVKKVILEDKKKAVVPTSDNLPIALDEDDVVIVEADGINERPRGAILSLALGLCIAAIMITLVGCRLRVVQRRLRRGKAGYAHDADFLVNGMYL